MESTYIFLFPHEGSWDLQRRGITNLQSYNMRGGIKAEHYDQISPRMWINLIPALIKC